MTPTIADLSDPARRWRVQLRARTAVEHGAIRFDAAGLAVCDGGRPLLRIIAALGPDIESVEEERPDAPVPLDRVVPPEPEPAADPRIARAAALKSDGLTWAQIGREIGCGPERARQLGKLGRAAATP